MSLLTHCNHDDRPWGSFDRFTQNELSTVKIITVSPNKRLSLQKHAHRSEFWHIISGSGIVTINDTEYPSEINDEFEIPIATAHRIKANEKGIVFLEIALGDFNEDDIVRLSDDFGRATNQ